MIKKANAGAKILVVDDDPVNTELMSKILEVGGYENIVTLNDSSLFWDVFAEHAPDLVILDYIMPIKNGYTILKEFKEKNNGHIVPTIIVSAQSDEGSRMEAFELGARDFIGKPYNYKEVLNKVELILNI